MVGWSKIVLVNDVFFINFMVGLRIWNKMSYLSCNKLKYILIIIMI